MIDLRSDLMKDCSASVAQAMYDAALRPPAMMRGEDPDEQRLLGEMCALFGAEAALLLPTCTMANQIALRVGTDGGGALMTGHLSHVLTVEATATALLDPPKIIIPAPTGHMSPDLVVESLQANQGPPPFVWLENTHMLSGGTLTPAGWQKQIATACQRAGSAIHLDGSRIWNAALGSGVSLSEVVAGADSISVSLNKALGAPLGAVLLGTHAMIEKAVGLRDALGGEWRPLGPIAAAAYAALDGWEERLGADHARTQSLAAAIAAHCGDVLVAPPQTNTLFVSCLEGSSHQIAERLSALGVQGLPIGPDILRLVVHSAINDNHIETVAKSLAQAMG